MWIRGASTLTLALLLLLTSAVGLAGHEHASNVERGATECSLDHERLHGSPDGPELESAGERHDHHCVACRHSGQRTSLTAPPVFIGFGPDAAGSLAASPRPRVELIAAGGTLRGPPPARV